MIDTSAIDDAADKVLNKQGDMHNVIKLIALVVLTLIIVLTYINKAQAGGPWNDQYCNVKTTQVKVVDTNGVVVKEYTEEIVQCYDGAKDFLHGYGFADY